MMGHSNDASTVKNLTEDSLGELLANIQGLSLKPESISQEGIDRMKALTDANPEFKARVLAEFPQMAAVLA